MKKLTAPDLKLFLGRRTSCVDKEIEDYVYSTP